MSQTASGHWSCNSVPATAVPVTLFGMFTTAGGQARKFLALANPSDNNNVLQLGLDLRTSFSNCAAALESGTGGSNANQALSTTPVNTSGGWNQICCVFPSNTTRVAYLNGVNKGSSTATVTTPTGLSEILVSGRASDFTFGLNGQASHSGIITRAITDAEAAYLGAGGNPRHLHNLAAYWKFTTGQSPVNDEVGSYSLTASTTMGAGTTDPNFQSFMTGTALSNPAYTVGTAISNVDFSAGNGIFDNVASAFTVSLCQLGSPTSVTTTTSGLTGVREIPVASVSGITANGYIKITASGTPTRVLWVDSTNITVLVADDQTYSNSSAVYYFAVNPLSLPGLSFTSNVWGGTPTTNSTNSNCFWRATCTGATSLVADTNQVTITITGGGTGSSILMPAGVMCGGFIGG